MTVHGDLNTGAFRLDELGVSTGEMLAATASQAIDDMPVIAIQRIGELNAATGERPPAGTMAGFFDEPAPMRDERVARTPIADARQRVKDEGLDKELTLPDQDDIATPALDIMLARARERHERKATIARGPSGFTPTALSVGTSFLLQAVDPINVASAFIPVMGEIRYARALASAGESLVARAAARAPLGAIEGAAGAAVVEPLIMAARWHEGADYTMGDFLTSLAFGAGLGAGLHVSFGGARDLYRARRGEAQYPFGPGEPLRAQKVERITARMQAGGVTAPDLDALAARPDIPRDHPAPATGEAASVHDDIRGQLKAAGLGDAEADANAAVVAARYRTRAERLGVGEMELYRSEGIVVRAAGEPVEPDDARARRFDQAPLKPAIRDADEAVEALDDMSAFVREVYGAHYPGAADFADVIADFARHVEQGLPIDRGPVARLLDAARRIDFDQDGDAVPDAVDELLRSTGQQLTESFIRRGGYEIGSTISYEPALGAAIEEVTGFPLPRERATPSLDRALREIKAIASAIDEDRYVAPRRLRDVRTALDAADREVALLREAEAQQRLRDDEDFEAGDPLEADALADAVAALKDEIATAIRTADAVTFDQRAFDGGPRGRITLAENRAVIELFRTADRSTFMHESAHLWLDELVRDARRADAPDQLRQDLATTLEWLGARDGNLKTEHHEKWAAAFERYLADGRAPSEGLARAFEQFRDWLAAIYRALTDIGEEIPDSIRGVMDRMLATDAEIAARPSPVMAALADLPGPVQQDLLRGSIAALTQGQPVRAGEMIEAAAQTDARIAESLSMAGSGAPRSLSAAAPRDTVPLLRLAADAIDGLKSRLREMFARVMASPPAEPGKLTLGEVTPEGAARINAALRAAGVEADVTGYRHEVDAYAARHAVKQHGNPDSESARGQIALTAEDWAMIPDVLAAPDRVDYAGRTGIGREGISVLKRINGHMLVIEEVRTGRGTLAVTSVWKYKTGDGGVPGRPDAPDGTPSPDVRDALPGTGHIGGARGRVESSAFEALGRATEDPEVLSASHAADKVKEPDSLKANARVAAAEAYAAEADALYKASEPYLPEADRLKVEADVKALEDLSTDRATALEQGAACLAAAVG